MIGGRMGEMSEMSKRITAGFQLLLLLRQRDDAGKAKEKQ